jgi:2-polyprenyl-3-methyl-5-hydroxy-6-metoxy-1,4-benzoquinol methylase
MKIRSFLNDIRIKRVKSSKPSMIGRFEISDLKNYIVLTNKKTFLDFGCGFGEEISQACELGFSPIAFDVKLYPEMLTAIKLYPQINLRIGKISLLNSLKVDIIHCNHVLEHIHNDEDILNLFKKIINKNGVLLLAVPNIVSLKTLFPRFIGFTNYFSDPTHVREYTLQDISEKLRRAGFKAVKIKTSGLGLPLKGASLFLRLLDKNRFLEKNIPNIFFIHDSINLICVPVSKKNR